MSGSSVAGLGQRTVLVAGAALHHSGVSDGVLDVAGGVWSTRHLRSTNVALSTLTPGSVEDN